MYSTCIIEYIRTCDIVDIGVNHSSLISTCFWFHVCVYPLPIKQCIHSDCRRLYSTDVDVKHFRIIILCMKII